MKKIIKSIMLLPILAGCTININFQLAVPSEVVSNINNINNNNSTNNPAPTAEKYSVGLGYHAEWGGTVGTAAKFDLTTAFAAFDAEGKVYDVRFDVVQVKVTANTDEGATEALKLHSALVDGSVQTKLELGLAYGMKDSSYIGKEVNEQIEAFADWCVGKTPAEVVVGTTGAGHGIAVAPELEGKVTIGIDAFEAALQYAYDHKTTATYELSGTAGVAMDSGLGYGNSNSIIIEFAGAIAKDGKVEAALLDAIDYPLTFDSEGNINPNAASYFFVDGDTTKLRSKKDLGDAYGMAERNEGQDGCTKEWYEQAAIMEKACVGKTAAEISAFVANEDDLAGVTINVYDAIKALSKACDYAGRTVINPN